MTLSPTPCQIGFCAQLGSARAQPALAGGWPEIADRSAAPLQWGGESIALNLVREGHLEPVRAKAGASYASGAFAISTTSFLAATAHAPAAVPVAVRAPAASDPFEGKRSLATTRVFLFDLCERMFARRDPVNAEQFRQARRHAKDRASMLAAGREMIAEIELVAGADRADSISERIAMLMPPETAA